jgi:glycosyltransferase involved in cell wall biosynthesis
MAKTIDLIWLSESESPLPDWPLGEVWHCKPTPQAVHALTERRLKEAQSEAWLFWHSRLGSPNPEIIEQTLHKTGQVWHAGLALGMASLPEALDFVSPSWTFILDADSSIESSSWRLSLECCLISLNVLRAMGGVSPDFSSLSAASLELGYRYIKWGVFLRHIPSLLSEAVTPIKAKIALEDELRFMKRHFGRKQLYWMLFRMIVSGYASAWSLLSTWRRLAHEKTPPSPKPFPHKTDFVLKRGEQAQVSILIPTVDRYPYLRTLLGQLRQQTIPPCEIIIVDQSPAASRDTSLSRDFADLPLNYFVQDEAGQCSSRNAGLAVAKGDYILFIDDDDEVEANLIEQHLAALEHYQCDVSSGAAHEPESGALPENFTYTRASDVFPTNNTMIKREVLHRSGLFDLAYNKGVRADGDLGTRIYLNGTFMVYSPQISVLHHHAPSGGLRKHKARTITYAKSRQSLSQRRLPHITELYLLKRHFSKRQVREAQWLSLFGTFAIRANIGRTILKAIVASFQLPDTISNLKKRSLEAEKMLKDYPQIPELGV